MNDLLSLTGTIADTLALISAVFAVGAFVQSRRARTEAQRERDRMNERVNIALRLTDNSREIRLPVALRRADVTRAELLGRLGMLPMAERGKRFAINHLNTNEFLLRIDEIRNGNNDELVIPCSADEINQFAV